MNICKVLIVNILMIGSLWFNANSEGQIGPEKYGIGATLTRTDSVSPIVIRGCIPGGPAERAGLLPGDQILELDAHSIKGWSFEEVIDYLIDEKPNMLTITVLRDSSQVGVELLRARYSDIVAGINMKMARSPDSLSWQFVPMEEQPPLEIGSLLVPVGLQDHRCNNTELHLEGSQASVLYFWATWCGPCKLLIEELVASKEKISGSGMRLIGINVDNSCETFAAANDSLAPPGEQYWAGGYYGPLSQVLRVYRRGIPTGALVDQDGQLVNTSTAVYRVLELLNSIPIKEQ